MWHRATGLTCHDTVSVRGGGSWSDPRDGRKNEIRAPPRRTAGSARRPAICPAEIHVHMPGREHRASRFGPFVVSGDFRIASPAPVALSQERSKADRRSHRGPPRVGDGSRDGGALYRLGALSTRRSCDDFSQFGGNLGRRGAGGWVYSAGRSCGAVARRGAVGERKVMMRCEGRVRWKERDRRM